MTSIAEAARGVLELADPRAKVREARRVAREWARGNLSHRFPVAMPDRPDRPAEPVLLPPGRMPKRGKAGTERSRIALLHALAHIEFVAIDLAFDMIGRFGAQFDPSFVDDWMRVGADEAMHFAVVDRRLRQMGSRYGALPAHDGLWESAELTAQNVNARLAVVPMVLEARGLDVTPSTIDRFLAVGDTASAAILSRIYNDEIRHVRTGTKWFQRTCAERDLTPHLEWQRLVRVYFKGSVKPPFNDSARDSAGLSRDYYAGLADD